MPGHLRKAWGIGQSKTIAFYPIMHHVLFYIISSCDKTIAIEGRSTGLYDQHFRRRTHNGSEISVDFAGTWPPWMIFITLPYGLSGKGGLEVKICVQ
jgi:hypothetical protein